MNSPKTNWIKPGLPASSKTLWAVLLVVFAVLVVGTVALRFYLGEVLARHLREGFQRELTLVEQSVEQAFLANDFETVQKIVANLSDQGQLDRIRILNKDGVILASSAAEEVGIQMDQNGETCQACHNTEGPLPTFREPVMDGNEGSPHILTAKSLENQVACQSCHENTVQSLGLILVDRDPVPLNQQMNNLNWGVVSGAVLFFILLGGVLWTSLHRHVDQPLNELAAGMQPEKLAGRKDAFGQAAQRYVDLAAQLEQRTAQVKAQRRNFNATIALTESIDVTLAPEKVLQLAMSRVLEMTGFYSVAMRVYEAEHKRFRMVAQTNMTAQMVQALHVVPEEIGFTGDVLRTHRAAYTSDLANDARLENETPIMGGFCSLISVPFLSGDRLMGTMELASKEKHVFEEEEVRWLELIGRSIGMTLHQIEIGNQLQGLAVIHERSRIAQEIHDGLAQLVGTLRIWAEQGQLALQESDLDAVAADLEKIERNARDAYAGLREEILGLRDNLMPGKGILPVIQEYLIRYRRQWGIDTQLDNPGGLVSLNISPAAEVQLLRIIHEGLANVRRHARASQAVVEISETPQWLRVEIYDNGIGFEPQQVQEDKFGLRIMHERAESVGGSVTVCSERDKGTHLKIELPRQSSGRQGWRSVLENEA